MLDLPQKVTCYGCARLKMYDYNGKILYQFLPQFLPIDYWKDRALIDKELHKSFNDDNLVVASEIEGQLPFLILDKNIVKEKTNFRSSYNYTFTYLLTDKCSIGTLIQRSAMSREWKSASIIYQKYKKKFNLETKHLIQLRNYVCDFSVQRTESGKKVSNDYLTQIASEYIKKNYGN